VRKIVKVRDAVCFTDDLVYPTNKSRWDGALPGLGSVSEDHAEAIVTAVNAASEGLFRIVETDNFGSDYPNENFLLYPMAEERAKRIADAINASMYEEHSRFWKVEPVGYVLRPGFEP
jgi:hypothetical protein